ncbi:hypothetical protein ACJMK2_011652 [Sinanodonta woodiana]|uniref:EF-hand domain-containing protein n=1 Tax=Sinanodonta woodiana TaxID=1069815 RepID=A0ABD3V6Y5_SINWO
MLSLVAKYISILPTFHPFQNPSYNMRIIFIFALLLGVALGQNSHGLTLDQVIDRVVADLDKDHDGVITQAELNQEMIARWEHDGDGCLARHEFEKQWVATYHDHPNTVNEFFNRIDLNRDGCLDSTDINVHSTALDTNSDGVATVAEFRAFMHHVHPEGNGNHGG